MPMSLPSTRSFIIATASLFALALAGCNANQSIDAGAQQGVPATPIQLKPDKMAAS